MRAGSSAMGRWAMALLVGAAAPLGAQQVKIGNDITLTLHGILSATLFAQDARFGLGNGQQAEFVSQELAGWWHGGDVRNMRVTFDLQGPEVMTGWRANAAFEMDFFSAFNGQGAFSDEQPTPRLRLAYADLTNGRTTLRIGQAWALTLGNIPVSTSHIGFPYGWGSGGFIGWRFPGVVFIQSITRDTTRPRLQLQLAALRGSWSDEPTPDQPSAGEAGTPQFEGRLNLDGKLARGSWGTYLVGHWDRKNLNNVRAKGAPEPASNNLDSWAAEWGARVQSGPLTLHGNVYTGKAMGHHFAGLIQFNPAKSAGAWAQAGLDVSKHWSVWLYGGAERVNKDDLIESNRARFAQTPAGTPDDRQQNFLVVPMLRFKAGPYSLGLEWMHNETKYLLMNAASGAVTGTPTRKGNQALFSTRFDF